MKKLNYVFNGIIVASAIMALITIVLRFWGMEELNLSALTLIQGMFLAESKLNIRDNEFLKVLVFQVKFLLAAPYVTAVVVIVFGLLKQRWSHIVTAVLAAVEIIFLLVDSQILIPARLVKVADSVVETLGNSVIQIPYVGDLVWGRVEDTIGIGSSDAIKEFFTRGLGPGFWISVIVFVFVFMISVCAYFTYDMAGDPVNTVEKESAIICLCGDMAGLRIPMNPEDEIIIGSDARYCNLVVGEQGIDSKQCHILYHDGRYTVTGYAKTATILNEEISLRNSQCMTVERGTRLELGTIKNVLILE